MISTTPTTTSQMPATRVRTAADSNGESIRATFGRPTFGRGGRSYPLAAFVALAAAFISCLCARTLTSDSGPVMSATDRKDFASP